MQPRVRQILVVLLGIAVVASLWSIFGQSGSNTDDKKPQATASQPTKSNAKEAAGATVPAAELQQLEAWVNGDTVAEQAKAFGDGLRQAVEESGQIAFAPGKTKIDTTTLRVVEDAAEVEFTTEDPTGKQIRATMILGEDGGHWLILAMYPPKE